MASYDNTHSRLVAWLKIGLPLVALAILSTLFLIPEAIDPSRAIPYAKIDANELARDQRISAPHFSGVTSDGSAITLSADSARPDQVDPQVASAEKLKASIETSSGTKIEIVAATGVTDTTHQIAALSGGVKLTTSTGYQIGTNNLQARLDTTEITAVNPVTAETPMGTVQAGNMLLTQQTEAPEGQGYLLVFKGGVKLVYKPGRK